MGIHMSSWVVRLLAAVRAHLLNGSRLTVKCQSADMVAASSTGGRIGPRTRPRRCQMSDVSSATANKRSVLRAPGRSEGTTAKTTVHLTTSHLLNSPIIIPHGYPHDPRPHRPPQQRSRKRIIGARPPRPRTEITRARISARYVLLC